jgi:hypothetical protein
MAAMTQLARKSPTGAKATTVQTANAAIVICAVRRAVAEALEAWIEGKGRTSPASA